MSRLAALWLSLFAATVGATPIRVAAVTAEPGADRALVAVVAGARAALAAHEVLADVDVVGLLDPEASAAAAEAAFLEGQMAYEDLDADAAVASLSGAAPRLLAAGAPEKAARAYELLARIYLGLKKGPQAVEACRMWLRVEDPPRVDTATAPPSLRRALEAAAEPQAGTTALRIEADRPARVRLDGRLVGVTPVYLDAVVVGAHVISVEADGRRRAAFPLTLGTTGVAVLARLEPADKGRLLDGALSQMRGQIDRDVAGPGLRDLRALLAAEQAIVVERDGEEVRAALFDLLAGRRVRLISASLEGSGLEVGRRLVATLYGGLDPRAPGLAAPEVEVPDHRPYHQRWWFWPAVAAGAITAVAVPALLLSDDEQPGLTRKPGTGAVVIRF